MAALKPEAMLERLRRICLALPETSEVQSWGHPNFRAAKKTFAVFEQYQGEWAICCKVLRSHQALFLKDPRFYRTPYIGHQGWVSLRVAGRLDWEEIEELVVGSYRLVASAQMLKALVRQSPAIAGCGSPYRP